MKPCCMGRHVPSLQLPADAYRRRSHQIYTGPRKTGLPWNMHLIIVIAAL